MKRSYVALIIAESLVDVRFDDPMKEASYILKRLENLGMLPPLNENNYHHMDNDHRIHENETRNFYHKWEDEDEA